MFDRFSGRARRSMSRAREAAERLGHDVIGPVHLLLGVLDEEGGWADRTLRDAGIDPADVRTAAAEGSGPRQIPVGAATLGQIPFTLGAKRALEFALEECGPRGRLGTGHLLVGIVRTGEGPAVDALLGRGATPGRLRDALRRVLAELPDEDAAPTATFAAPPLSPPANPLGLVLRAARDAANARGHGFVGTEHLLLGIVATGDPAGATLATVGATQDALNAAIDRLRARGDRGPIEAYAQFTPCARRVLEGTEAEARALGHSGFGVGHLLLAILGAPEGLASSALRALGIDVAALRERVIRGVRGEGNSRGDAPAK